MNKIDTREYAKEAQERFVEGWRDAGGFVYDINDKSPWGMPWKSPEIAVINVPSDMTPYDAGQAYYRLRRKEIMEWLPIWIGMDLMCGKLCLTLGQTRHYRKKAAIRKASFWEAMQKWESEGILLSDKEAYLKAHSNYAKYHKGYPKPVPSWFR